MTDVDRRTFVKGSVAALASLSAASRTAVSEESSVDSNADSIDCAACERLCSRIDTMPTVEERTAVIDALQPSEHSFTEDCAYPEEYDWLLTDENVTFEFADDGTTVVCSLTDEGTETLVKHIVETDDLALLTRILGARTGGHTDDE